MWELEAAFHCSIIGTCLSVAELRKLLSKLGAAGPNDTDHDLHGRGVSLAAGRATQAAKLLHRALDDRHDLAIRRFGRAKHEVDLRGLWDEALQRGDVPGPYWALLTHPAAPYELLRAAAGHVHMLSHLVGAANRADIRRLTALEEENAALRDKVERQQARLHEVVSARDETIRRLGTLAAGQVKAQGGSASDDGLATLRHLLADLQARLARETARRERLEQRVAEATTSLRAAEVRARTAESGLAAAERELAALDRCADQGEPGPALPPRRVLYVGGRPSAVEQMRAALTEAGGELLVHDGGRHDHPSLLPGLIGQADMVAFPVDCVSHDAALTVKRLCRQQAKPWAPLRSSGLGSFLAALTERQAQPEMLP